MALYGFGTDLRYISDASVLYIRLVILSILPVQLPSQLSHTLFSLNDGRLSTNKILLLSHFTLFQRILCPLLHKITGKMNEFRHLSFCKKMIVWYTSVKPILIFAFGWQPTRHIKSIATLPTYFLQEGVVPGFFEPLI